MSVPKYIENIYSAKSSDYCICVFVINEGEKIQSQIKRMQQFVGLVDIVVVDGGSTDGSLSDSFLAEHGVTSKLTKNDYGRLGTQMRIGFGWAQLKGYKGVIVVDGNGKDDVSAIPKFIEYLRAGWDYVQGSRFLNGGHHENTPLLRLIGLRLVHAPLLSIASGFCYSDTTNGFRAYSMGFLSDPRVGLQRPVFTGYELHYYLALSAAKLGFRTVEIPVTRIYPKFGKVPTKISPIKGNFDIIRKLLLVCVGYYNV